MNSAWQAVSIRAELRLGLIIGALAVAACDMERPVDVPRPSFDESPQAAEGEFIGSVYVSGVRSTSTSYFAQLSAFDAATAARLRAPNSPTMWANPNLNWMWEWFDPRAGGNCGGLTDYLNGNTSARAFEIHWAGPSDPPDPTAREAHCIRPGIYEFSAGGKAFFIDYLPIVKSAGAGVGALQVSNSTAGINEQLEA